MSMQRHTSPDLFGRPVGHENYGADPDSDFPDDDRGPVDRPPAPKKVSRSDWQNLVEQGFTDELGSPRETTAFEELVKKAPIGTVYAFINGMTYRLRQAYVPPLVKLLQKRLKGSDLTFDPEGLNIDYKKALGNATKSAMGSR